MREPWMPFRGTCILAAGCSARYLWHLWVRGGWKILNWSNILPLIDLMLRKVENHRSRSRCSTEMSSWPPQAPGKAAKGTGVKDIQRWSTPAKPSLPKGSEHHHLSLSTFVNPVSTKRSGLWSELVNLCRWSLPSSSAWINWDWEKVVDHKTHTVTMFQNFSVAFLNICFH